MSESTDPIPQMGHVKDGEKRYTANSIYASSSIHRDDQFVTLAAYQEVEAEKAAAEQTYCDRIEHLRTQLESVVAERDSLEATFGIQQNLIDETQSAYTALKEERDEFVRTEPLKRRELTRLRAELIAARATARTDAEEALINECLFIGSWTTEEGAFGLMELAHAVAAERALLTSLEGGQNPDSRQAESST